MPTTLHVVIAIATGYAVGTEFSRRNRRAWLRCAGGSLLVALVGKLWPLFVVFFVLLAIDALILHAGFELPYRGNILMMMVAAALFIAAYQALAALLQLLVHNLALGLSLTAIITSPAFGYAGIGLPVLAMGVFPRAWGALLPLRWYQQILFDQAARGSPGMLPRCHLQFSQPWRSASSRSLGCACFGSRRVAKRKRSHGRGAASVPDWAVRSLANGAACWPTAPSLAC